MVNTVQYARRLEKTVQIGAATNKMVSVVKALRCVGAKAYLVSLPVLGHDSMVGYVPSKILHMNGCPQLFFPVFANRIYRKLHGALIFGVFCAVKVNRYDKVILYGHSFEWWIGLLVLKLRGNEPILDIEDGAHKEAAGYYKYINILLFKIYCRFASRKKLVVSELLARQLGLANYLVVYGVAFPYAVHHREGLNKSCNGGGEVLRIHYGGSLFAETGVELFVSAVKLLMCSLSRDSCQVVFVVTGFGAEGIIKQLQRIVTGSGVAVELHANLMPKEYHRHFLSCQAALNLRLPDSKMSQTTFPSKVVEITCNGLLLITTRANDVPILFDESSAVLLPAATPEALANAILRVMAERETMREIACNGQRRALELFDVKTVGRRVRKFVMEHIE